MIIFASDYDDTLHFRGGIKETDLEQIRKLQSQGGLFGLISGRPISSLISEAKKHHIPVDFLIGVNGAMAVDHQFDEIFSIELDKKEGLKVIDFFNAVKPFSYVVHNGYDLSRTIFKPDDFDTRDERLFVPQEKVLKNPIYGFMSSFEDEQEAYEISTQMNQMFTKVKAQQNRRFIDVTDKSVNKANGLKKMVEVLNLKGKVWVIGDAQNDTEMIQSFDSFAMSNGDDFLKEHANYVVDSVAEAIGIILEMK